MAKKTYAEKYLQAKYWIIDEFADIKSKPSHGRVCHIGRNTFWMEIPSVEIDNMHISFGASEITRNKLIIEISTLSTVGTIKIKRAEVEWYELIKRGVQFKFNTGINISDISNEDRTKFDKLFEIYKKNG